MDRARPHHSRFSTPSKASGTHRPPSEPTIRVGLFLVTRRKPPSECNSPFCHPDRSGGTSLPRPPTRSVLPLYPPAPSQLTLSSRSPLCHPALSSVIPTAVE